MHRRLGFDPVRVRLHTGESAHRAADALRAAAFTVGEHIYFARGRFDPASAAGRELIAHELVHVRQQPAGRPFRPGEVSRQRHAALEAEARQPGSPRPEPPALVLAPPAVSAGPAAAVPMLAPETAPAASSPTPADETVTAGPAPPPASPPADPRQVAEDVYRLIERRLRMEHERTGVQRWR